MVGYNFEPSLRELIEAVWANIEAAPGELSERKIYKLYAWGQNGAPAPFDAGVLTQVHDALLAHLDPNPARNCVVQGNADDWPSLADYLTSDRTASWQVEAFNTFYHFALADDPPEATHRVYLSTPLVATTGPPLLGHVLGLMEERSDWIINAKLTGPGGQDRRDHLVVYCTGRLGQEYVVGEILDRAQDLVGTTNPASTFAVAPGIGIADETPSLRDGQDEIVRSHGSLMAKVIWSVAAKYCDPFASDAAELPTLDRFLAEAYEEFHRWRIEPTRPFRTDRARVPPRKLRSPPPYRPGEPVAAAPSISPAITPTIASHSRDS